MSNLTKFINNNRELRFLRVLNLGAGVQSTTLYLMMHEGRIDKADVAIFGDTQGEPKEVYEHLKWLQTINDPPIMIRSRGSLSDNLARGVDSTGRHFVSIPAFTAPDQRIRTDDFKPGMTRRQCTAEYKLQVVDRTIRRECLGLAPRARISKVYITQYFGISADEAGRAERIKRNIHPPFHPVFPLLTFGMTRADCVEWLRERVPHRTPRSACVFCPFKSDAEWLRLQQSPEDWAEAVRVDEVIRDTKSRCTQAMDHKMYLHRSCVPLALVKLNPARDRVTSFSTECVGMCGN